MGVAVKDDGKSLEVEDLDNTGNVDWRDVPPAPLFIRLPSENLLSARDKSQPWKLLPNGYSQSTDYQRCIGRRGSALLWLTERSELEHMACSKSSLFNERVDWRANRWLIDDAVL